MLRFNGVATKIESIMSNNFYEKSDNTLITYATKEEIENIINSALNKNLQSIQD